MAVVSAVASTRDGLREAEQNINLLNDHLGNVDQANLASRLDLQGIFIDDGNGASHLMLRPTHTTERELNYHNNRRRESNPDHLDVSMEELSGNPSETFRRLFVPQ